MRFAYHPSRQNAIDSLLTFSFGERAAPRRHSPLSHILSVGATRDSVCPSFLSAEDSHYTFSALMHLDLIGLDIDPDFRHSTLNIMNGEQEDFLSHPQPCDVLIIGYIPFAVPNISPAGKSGLRISEKHFLKESWANAARTSEAKVIFTFGGSREIGPAHFAEHPDYLHIPPYHLEEAYRETHSGHVYHSGAGVILRKDVVQDLLGFSPPVAIRDFLQNTMK